MFNIFNNNKTVLPIGIDMGSDSLKMVQLARNQDKLSLVAAARAEVPADLRPNKMTRQKWFIETIREFMTVKPFKGRKVCLALPSREVFIDHIRLNCPQAQIAEKIELEAANRLPFNPQHGIIRHTVVGDIYEENETRKEVIMMAVPKKSFEYYMGILDKCKLEADKINIEPCGLISGFAPLIQKSHLKDSAYFIIDLGFGGTRILGLHGDKLSFSRNIAIGAEQICQAAHHDHDEGASESNAQASGGNTATATLKKQNTHLKAIYCNLRDEIQHCIWYHDMLFPHQPLNSLIFLGGLACQTGFCQSLAQALELPAQLADSISQVQPETLVGPHSDITNESGNYEWSLAFGLSLNKIPELGETR